MIKQSSLITPLLMLSILLLVPMDLTPAATRVSEDTQSCLECHATLHPGIVAGWERSRHFKTTPAEALKKTKLERRISSREVPESLATHVVGCAECHTLNADAHKDTFEHNGYDVHIVVTPGDCAVCHTQEAGQYEKNLMSRAYGNLVKNPVYMDMADTTNGTQVFGDLETILHKPNPETRADACLHCHGTVVQVTGTVERSTDMGDVEVPLLSGWPNQGVGRVNPDGTLGSCAACHTRHQFSIQMARKPHTCSQCHKGPDVPIYKIYSVSKHGNIYGSLGKEWNFDQVPWRPGRDFTAPTCAACHVSLLVNEEHEVIAGRTHQMNDRLAWRLFGLIYAHPHPIEADTSVIRNKAGLPLPTDLTGEFAAPFLIDNAEMDRREQRLKRVCVSCHSQGWVEGHFVRLKNSIQTTNEMTLTGTRILLTAWEKGLARGPEKGESLFDEAIEKMWAEQWLFFSNSTRLASAMSGADYGVFDRGRWYMAKNIQEMLDRLHLKMGK
jgi:uncharacterized protein with PIN domain